MSHSIATSPAAITRLLALARLLPTPTVVTIPQSGSGALNSNTSGTENTALGASALIYNLVGGGNTAVGSGALIENDTGYNNTAIGQTSLPQNTSGFNNTAVGSQALSNNTTGSHNIGLGEFAAHSVHSAENVICIGSNVAGADVSNTTWIGNIYGVTTQNATTAPAVVSADGQLGTVASSERFKKDIITMDKSSEAIQALLRPVTFHYKTDNQSTPQFGLIAEEVAKVNPGPWCCLDRC